jgi:hypothetical protein
MLECVPENKEKGASREGTTPTLCARLAAFLFRRRVVDVHRQKRTKAKAVQHT